MKKIILTIVAVVALIGCTRTNYDTETRVLQVTGGTIVFIDTDHILYVPSTSAVSPIMYNLKDNSISEEIQIDEISD